MLQKFNRVSVQEMISSQDGVLPPPPPTLKPSHTPSISADEELAMEALRAQRRAVEAEWERDGDLYKGVLAFLILILWSGNHSKLRKQRPMVLTTLQAWIVCLVALAMPTMVASGTYPLLQVMLVFTTLRSLFENEFRMDLFLVLCALSFRFFLIQPLAIIINPSAAAYFASMGRGDPAGDVPLSLQPGSLYHWASFTADFLASLLWAYSWLSTTPPHAEAIWHEAHGRTFMYTIGAFSALYNPAVEGIIESFIPIVNPLIEGIIRWRRG